MMLAAVALETTYGSDRDGLVWGYLFSGGLAGKMIDAQLAAAWLAEPPPVGEFLWLHFNIANAAALRWLKQHLELPDTFREGLEGSGISTRLEQDDGVLVAVLHDVIFDFQFDATEVASVGVAVTERVLVSARSKPLRSIDRLRGKVKSGADFASTVELFAQLLRDQADVLAEIIRNSTGVVDKTEDAMLERRRLVGRSKLSTLRRTLVRLQRMLAPEPAALFRLLSRPPRWVSETDQQELRQAAEEFSRTIADSLALAERIKLIQEEQAALINEQNNGSLFVLTLVTVAAVPFNVVGALFGMNVAGIPLGNHPHAFWIVVALVGLFTILGGWIGLRRR